jgi:flavorubredoxin
MNKVGLAFGSYGWSRGAVRAIISEMEATGIAMLDDSIEIQFVPKPSDLNFKEIVDKLVKKMEV